MAMAMAIALAPLDLRQFMYASAVKEDAQEDCEVPPVFSTCDVFKNCRFDVCY